jgi:chemotaxis protein methyltransferase CheR
MSKLTKEEFSRELNGYWKKLRINFIDIPVLESWIIQILENLVYKNSMGTTVIYVTSYSLSIYLNRLGIDHVYLSPYKDLYSEKMIKEDLLITSKEIGDFLEEMHRVLGKDFRNYDGSLFENAVKKFMVKNYIPNFKDFREYILNDETLRNDFIDSMSITFSSFFRDKEFFKFLRETILPKMKSHYHLNIWSAGCSNGMEAYSIAIILFELGLLDRSYIYATDFNSNILQIGKNAMYSKDVMNEVEKSYKESGGSESINKYFNDCESYVKVKDFIRDKVVFFKHDLTNDGNFNEFNIILCRNVLIYFNDELKKTVLKLFYDSMTDSGYLGLGSSESIHLLNYDDNFIQYKQGFNIYRKSIEGLMEVGRFE